MDKDRLADSPRHKAWTRIDEYIVALHRQRLGRRRRVERPRTQPQEPRFSLSTLPFLALMAVLAMLTVAIAIAAWPTGRQPAKQQRVPPSEIGTAPPGWFEDATREMR